MASIAAAPCSPCIALHYPARYAHSRRGFHVIPNFPLSLLASLVEVRFPVPPLQKRADFPAGLAH